MPFDDVLFQSPTKAVKKDKKEYVGKTMPISS
jgi:hypothetical protein